MNKAKRQDFIEQTLRKKGRINRSDLVDQFKISPQQAGMDFDLFRAANPGRMEYNHSERCYEANDKA